MKIYPVFFICLSLAVSLALGACASSSGPVEKTVYIAPQMIDCPGASSKQCLQAGENPEEEHTIAVESIEGFEFVPGYDYELRVVEEGAADVSERRWRLVEVVSKMPVSSPLEDKQWFLASYANPAGELVNVLSGTQVTLEFMDGKLSGNAGCNGYSGDFHADAIILTIDSIVSTEMFCTNPEGVMEQESAYLEDLLRATSYTIEGENLAVLSSDGETILVFGSSQPLMLTGETWQMVSLISGQGEMVPAIPGSSVTAIFSQDGRLTGSAGCNHYGTAYTLDGEQITIPAPATTRIFCSEPEGVMEQEHAYLQVLVAAATYKVQQGILELYDVSGSFLVRFQNQQSPVQTEQLHLAGSRWVWRDFENHPLLSKLNEYN